MFVRHALAQRARLADHADHVAFPRAARRAPRCTSCWSTTAAPSASAWRDFWYSLKCIRCGACMNTCPVYRRSGGLSYGSTYSGPIGVIIDPTFNLRKYSSLPFASTLNGSCTSVCPVKINIHEQIYKWRQIIAERHQLPIVKKRDDAMAGKVLADPKLYRAAVEAAGRALEHLPRFVIYNPLNAWGRQREMPDTRDKPFATGTWRRGSVVSSRDEILAACATTSRRRRPSFPISRCSSDPLMPVAEFGGESAHGRQIRRNSGGRGSRPVHPIADSPSAGDLFGRAGSGGQPRRAAVTSRRSSTTSTSASCGRFSASPKPARSG